ncbi:MAG: D-alanyl-D-alanine carboxypeptidase [Eggerthellaceae bacterium]|nr:D-alanyl-D-alanine carboxypeptidase [Eggerthellaceae bacterium]MCH4220593.1 D-alanyl-D-alanine carboxypeptidase [Eggerthellaceae bacterium]
MISSLYTKKQDRLNPEATAHGMSSSLIYKMSCLFFACCIAIGCAFPISAQAEVRKSDVIAGDTVENRGIPTSSCPSIDAQYAYVMDSDGNIYFQRSDTDSTCIASITKIMTAIVALDYATLDTNITVSQKAASIGESSAQLQKGDELTLEAALNALLLPSGNDAAEAIAESLGAEMLEKEGKDTSNSEDCQAAFVQAMNDKASELGLVNTVFRNPHGLDDGEYAGDQHSCSRDVATEVAYAMKKEAFRAITSKASANIQVKRDNSYATVQLTSTDELIGIYDGACGVKTGFTDLAGPSFAGACSRDGKDLYAIVIHSSGEEQRFTDAETLYDWVYDHQMDYQLIHTDKTLVNANGQSVPYVADVADSAWTDKTIPATADANASINLFTLSGNVSQTVTYSTINGAVKAGDVVGTITFKQQNQVVGTTNLIAAQDVAAPNIFESIGIQWNRFIGSFTGSSQVADSSFYNETPTINDKTSSSVLN